MVSTDQFTLLSSMQHPSRHWQLPLSLVRLLRFSAVVESVGKWRLDYGRELFDGCVPVLRRALCLRWLREVYKCSLWNANHMRAVLFQHHRTPSFCPAAVACFPWLMPKKLGSKLFYVMHKWSEPCVWVSLVDCCLQKSYFTVTVPNFHLGIVEVDSFAELQLLCCANTTVSRFLRLVHLYFFYFHRNSDVQIWNSLNKFHNRVHCHRQLSTVTAHP